MSKTHIPAWMRRHVIGRSKGICEYCLIPEIYSYFGFEIDHIIAEKHAGPTVLENLAYACYYCNLGKGSDVGSIHWPSREFVRLFNPRNDRWSLHFRLVKSRIEGLTSIGIVTARLLEFNRSKRLQERRVLIRKELYPSAAGMQRMTADPETTE